MRTQLVEQAESPVRITEGDQAFAEDLDLDGLAVRLSHLAFEQDGHPVAAQDLAHRRPGPRPGDQLIVFSAQHARPPRWCYTDGNASGAVG